jgi:hypothetical protein
VWTQLARLPFAGALGALNQGEGFYGPIAAAAQTPTQTLVVYGTTSLWGALGSPTTAWGTGFTWFALPTSPMSPTGAPPPTQIDGHAVVAIAFAGASRIFAATVETVWRYDGSGAAWSSTPIPMDGLKQSTYNPPLITSLAPTGAASDAFYVAIGGYARQLNLPPYSHVWLWDGAAWVSARLCDFSGAILDVPCHAVVVDPANPDRVYVGSDVGVFRGTRAGVDAATWTWTWEPFSLGLPQAAITDLQIHARTRLLRAATHGRGVWECPIDGPGTPATDVYLRCNYADTGRIVPTQLDPSTGGVVTDERYRWVAGAADPTTVGGLVYHWMSADIKVRRALASVPPPSTVDYLAFEVPGTLGDSVDAATHLERADASGDDRVFVQVHNRGYAALQGAEVKVLVLVADAGLPLPSLPTDYAQRINAQDTSGWLGGSGWYFADPATPYKPLPGVLDVRTPQIVEVDLDFSLRLPGVQDHASILAFAFTPGGSELIASGHPAPDELVWHEKHMAIRNLHLVPLATGRGHPAPKTFIVDVHDPGSEAGVGEIVIDRAGFPGHLSLMSSPLRHVGAAGLEGLRFVERGHAPPAVEEHLDGWLRGLDQAVERLGDGVAREARRAARLRKLRTIDRGRMLVVEGPERASLGGIALGPHGRATLAVTLAAPAHARPGDTYRFDILRKSGGRIVGGSSYVVAVAGKRR